MPLPVITLAQLNRRGACIEAMLDFRARYGKKVLVSVEEARKVAQMFDFAWAACELLFEPDGKEVRQRVIERCKPPDDGPWLDGETSLIEAIAEEFARQYIAVYPIVP